tara:strand:- start:3513 stop:3791 length:279 start_codon:yes stop_codon:yes gene_type:complete
MKEEKSVQWLNVDVPSVLSGVPEENKFKSPVIFGTGGEYTWLDYLKDTYGDPLIERVEPREPQVRTLEFDEDYYPYKGYVYPELNEERISER